MRGKKGGSRLLYMLKSFLVHWPPPSNLHVLQPVVETAKWSSDLSLTDANEVQHCPSLPGP